MLSFTTTTVRIRRAEEYARGERITPGLIDEMAAEAARVVEPIEDVRGPADYKRQLVHVLVRRALAAANANEVGDEA